jgi:hypothetical protein
MQTFEDENGISCGGCNKKLRILSDEVPPEMLKCSECGYQCFYGQSCLEKFEAAKVQGHAIIAKQNMIQPVRFLHIAWTTTQFCASAPVP